MDEIKKALDRYVAKNQEPNSPVLIQREIEEMSARVTELDARVNRDLERSWLRLEASLLIFETRVLLLALRERTDPEQPEKRIETIADLEVALRTRPE